jgi:3-oxoacyl-[acyl-carrier protein] reductase
MSDPLVELSTKPWFRQTVKRLGLPLPTPQLLRRAKGPRSERPLEDQTVVVCTAPGGRVTAELAHTLTRAGASPQVVTDTLAPVWNSAGEAWGRPPVQHNPSNDLPDDLTAHALLLDATGLTNADDLRALYDFMHPWLRRLRRNGRVIVIGRPPASAPTPQAAGAAAALDGFVRSLAKEIGRKGATAHVVYVPEDAHDRLEGLLRFLLSARSAFISGQPWTLSAQVSLAEASEWAQPLIQQTVLITGAARGIGAATAKLLAAEGAHVICLDRPGDEALLAKVARDIGGTPLSVDITDPGAAEAIQACLDARGCELDALIHNAGITRDKTLARMKPEWWDQAVAVNFGAVMTLTTALLERGLADGARIVCLSSVAGLAGNVGQSNYSAGKAGLVGYVRALAPVIAERNLTINAIAPGFIETRLTAAIPAVTREVGRRLSALGQGGLPEDVGEAITYLCTPASAGLTGQVVRVCGGMFIGA